MRSRTRRGTVAVLMLAASPAAGALVYAHTIDGTAATAVE